MANVPYLGDPAQVRVYPEAGKALKRLQEQGFLLFIVSNQSGVGRGWITRQQVEAVEAELVRQLGDNFFQAIYNCYDSPEDPYGECRKPLPTMLLRASKEHKIDLAKSFMVGDRDIDMECGRSAGCRTVLMLTGVADESQAKGRLVADHVAANLADAADWICQAAKF